MHSGSNPFLMCLHIFLLFKKHLDEIFLLKNSLLKLLNLSEGLTENHFI